MHRHRFHPGHFRPDASGIIPIQSWDDYDPRAEAFYSEENRYISGPGAFLPAEQQPYSTRSEGVPYKICIRGIHHHTTPDGIQHVLYNYGNPLNVDKVRNRFNESVAFAEFVTQREAENAIIALDGKPPLNWRVSYAYSQRQEDRFVHELGDEMIVSEIERQQNRHDVSRIVTRAMTPANPAPLPVAPVVLPAAVSSQSMDFLLCVLCRKSARTVCGVCKTRYCSVACQEADWPSHRRVCFPPPPLEVAVPSETVRPTAMQPIAKENGVHLPFLHKPAGVPAPISAPPVQVKSEATIVSTDSAHSFVIKGIHPLDQPQTKSSPASAAPVKVENKSLPKEGKVSSTPPLQNGQGHSAKPSTNRSPKWASPTFNNLSSKPGSVTPPMIPPHVQRTAPQQPKMRYLGSQTLTSPSQSSRSSVNPSPMPETKKYAKSYPKPDSLFPGRDSKPVVSICFVKSPGEFFVQPASHRKELQLMSDDIQRTVTSCDGVLEPTLGSPCVAAYKEDGKWYRAQILKIFPGNPTELGVRFIDYGNVAKMPNTIKNFRMLELQYAKYPGFAVKVKLADVLPPNGSTWESYVNEPFEGLVQNQEFVLETIRLEEDQVVVARMKTRNGHDLGAELVHRGLAKTLTQERISNDLDPKSTPPRPNSLVPPPPQVAQKPLLPSPASIPAQNKVAASKPVPPVAAQNKAPASKPVPTAAPILAQKNAIVSQPVSSTTNNIPKRELNNIPKPTQQATTKPAGQGEGITSVKQREIKTSPAPPQPASRLPIPASRKSNSIISKLEEGTSVTFMVLELNDDHVIGTLAAQDCLPVLSFHDLVSETPSEENFRPAVNTIVSAFSESFSSWYRGYVVKTRESACDIFYVDYGNLDYGVQKLKPLPSDFDYPELAVKLVLPKQLQPDMENFVKETMHPESTFDVVISAALENGCMCNVLNEDGQIQFAARLEPWTVLLPKEIASPDWEPGFSSDVLVISAEDVNQIFVQSADVADTVARVEQELLKCAQNFDAIPPFKCAPKPGSYVAAYFPDDGALYRAKVLSVEDGALTVQYIDYGNSCSITLNLMRPLPESLYVFPACGRFVSLSCVERPAGPLPEPVKGVLTDCVDHLCRVFVVAVNGECAEVTLTKDECLVNQQITDIVQSLNKPASMPALAPAQPEEPQEKPPVDYTLGYFTYDDCSYLNLPEEGTCRAIILSNDEPRSIMLCLADEENLNKLAELQEEIQEYANMVNRSHTPQQGEICLARSASDGLWYRAACLEVVESPKGPEFNMYCCIQVDYGEVITSEFSGLLRIPKRFVEGLPLVAVQAVLKEFVNFETEVDDRLIQVLREILPQRSIVELSVVGRDGDAYVVDIPAVGEKLAEVGFL